MESDPQQFYYSDSMYTTLELMGKFGGSFASSLARTYLSADIHNRRQIFATWPELFQKYGPNGIFPEQHKEES